jgi:sugar lactone lactonase YvrE
VHPRYNQDESFGAIAVKERGAGTESVKTVVFDSRGETVATLQGRPVRFFGNVVVTQDGSDSFSPGHYHFKDSLTGAEAVLDSSNHGLEFSPDGSRFYYIDHGAVHLVEVNPEVVASIERARRRSASPD